MKFFLFIGSVIILSYWLTSCSSSSAPTQAKDTTVHHDSLHINEIRILAHHLRPLRKPEGYIVWLKFIDDPNWHRVDPISFFFRGDDTTSILYHADLAPRIDSLSEVLVTLEKDTSNVSGPTLQLWHGFFSGDSSYKFAPLDPTPLGNFSTLNSSLVFTTRSSDTSAYVKEFYLAAYDGAKFSSSLSTLPLPSSGWKYAIWAIDSVNFPLQFIYYGQFLTPTGHDSDSSRDAQAYPGGFNNAPMNQPHGSIILTLEPDWYGNEVRLKGPSPFSLLRFDRNRFLIRDHNYPMTNVSSSAIPGGYITVKHK
jgi:hypothetical protein